MEQQSKFKFYHRPIFYPAPKTIYVLLQKKSDWVPKDLCNKITNTSCIGNRYPRNRFSMLYQQLLRSIIDSNLTPPGHHGSTLYPQLLQFSKKVSILSSVALLLETQLPTTSPTVHTFPTYFQLNYTPPLEYYLVYYTHPAKS